MTTHPLPTMTDTQWPRFEVFKQDKPSKPHEAVGSVHAPDAEMAMLNARNVFVRRPSAVSLMVVPAEAIFTITREEIAQNRNWWIETGEVKGGLRPFLIFTKTNQRRSMTYVKYSETIHALTAKGAVLTSVKNSMFDTDSIWVWWSIPQSAITYSQPTDIPSHFAPANDKTYRQQNQYGFVSPSRKRRGRSGNQ